MGEPLHNLEAVLAATDIMTHHLGLHMSHNKVSHPLRIILGLQRLSVPALSTA